MKTIIKYELVINEALKSAITIHLTSRLMNLSAFSADISVLTEYIFSKIVKKDMAQTIRMNGVHRE